MQFSRMEAFQLLPVSSVLLELIHLVDACNVQSQSDLVSSASDPEANIIMENHEFGMPPAHYAEWPVLNRTYNILSTTRDRRACCAFVPRSAQVLVCLLL